MQLFLHFFIAEYIIIRNEAYRNQFMTNKLDKTIDWLLQDDNPPVKKRALVSLQGYDEDAPKVRKIAEQVNEYPPIRIILEHWEDWGKKGGKWDHPYKKYEGGFWQLHFLGEMGADGNDERIKSACEHLIEWQQRGMMFYPNRNIDKPYIHCLTANVLRSMYKLGFQEDERVWKGLEALASSLVRDGGAKCFVLEVSLPELCHMTLPWVLSAFTSIPEEKRTETMNIAIDVCVKRLLEKEVFVYVPDIATAWAKRMNEIYKETKTGKGAEAIKAEIPQWQEKLTDKFAEKDSWKKFGFPLHYNPDLLESLLGLKAAGIANVPEVQKALDIVESKVGKDGKWKMNRSLNGKMLTDVEKRGEPSKWITLRALEVLKYWGRIA